MKITAFLLLVFLAVFISKSEAQIMMVGVRTGVNLANEKYKDLDNGEYISMRPLFLGGGQIDYHFTNSSAISLQFLFDQKGSHGEMGSGDFKLSTADWTISYLEIPVMAKIYLWNSSVRPYFFAGPSFGFLLRNIEWVHSHDTFVFGVVIPKDNYLDSAVNITDSTSKFEFSLVAGVGISFTLASGFELFLDGSYAYGLTNINNYYVDKVKDYYIYSRDIRIAAGILFPL